MRRLLVLFLLHCAFLHRIDAVKIGVSKSESTETNSANTTTTTSAESTESEHSTAAMQTTTDISTLTSTTIKQIAFDSFPPKKTKTTVLKSIKPPTTTTPTKVVSASTATESTIGEIDTSATPAHTAKPKGNGFFCSCDIHFNVCDINCCCDPHCPPEALQVFDCHAESMYPELRNRLEDFQYQHGLPSCKLNDGWLCVFRTNTRPTKKKSLAPNLDTSHYYKWPTALQESESTSEMGFYRYGEPLKVLNMETLELRNFELPYAYNPPHCKILEPIRHLTSSRRSCMMTSKEELQKHTKQLLQLAATNKLLSNPKQQVDMQEHFPPHDLREITVTSCLIRASKKNCNTIKLDSNTMEVELENSFATYFAVKIVHNYTNVLAAVVELQQLGLSPRETPKELWQTYEVMFLYKNLTTAEVEDANLDLTLVSVQQYEQIVSGSLGYLQGEPIIIAKYMAYNTSEEMTPNNRVLSYFHTNATKSHENYTLSLFTRRHELCHKNAHKENFIGFGINTLKQCKVRLNNGTSMSSDSPTEHNFTRICVNLQQSVAEQLFDADLNLELTSAVYVSQLGKPLNKSDKWTPLQVKNSEFPPIVGQLHQNAQSFTCRNILLSAAYEFHIGQYVEMGLPHQALVKHASIILGQRHDLEFSLDEVLEVPLSVSVMFYDFSSMATAGSGFRHFAKANYVFCLVLSLAVVIDNSLHSLRS